MLPAIASQLGNVGLLSNHVFFALGDAEYFPVYMFKVYQYVMLTLFVWTLLRKESRNLSQESRGLPVTRGDRPRVEPRIGDDLEAFVGDLVELLSNEEISCYQLLKELPSCLFSVLLARWVRKRRRRKP